jgi:hypothetical protein
VTNARLLRSAGLQSPHLPLDHARSTSHPRARHERNTLRNRARFRWELGSGASLLPPSLSALLRNRSASVANIPTEAPAPATIAAISRTETLDVFALVYSTCHPLASRRQGFVETKCARGHPEAPTRAKRVMESVQRRGNDDNRTSRNVRSKSNTLEGGRIRPSKRGSHNEKPSNTHPPNHWDQRMLRSATGLR